MEQIEKKVVLPNKLTIPLSKDVPMQVLYIAFLQVNLKVSDVVASQPKVFKCPRPKGVLRITLVEAR